ncbi:hypothetical protein F7O76_12005, partial [Neisseria meningitidis]|nr:hypothetical protein [Neisseria meningitidis]
MIESIEKPQESIRKTETPTASFPQKLESKTQRNRNLSEKQKTPTAIIPAQAGNPRNTTRQDFNAEKTG